MPFVPLDDLNAQVSGFLLLESLISLVPTFNLVRSQPLQVWLKKSWVRSLPMCSSAWHWGFDHLSISERQRGSCTPQHVSTSRLQRQGFPVAGSCPIMSIGLDLPGGTSVKHHSNTRFTFDVRVSHAQEGTQISCFPFL